MPCSSLRRIENARVALSFVARNIKERAGTEPEDVTQDIIGNWPIETCPLWTQKHESDTTTFGLLYWQLRLLLFKATLRNDIFNDVMDFANNSLLSS